MDTEQVLPKRTHARCINDPLPPVPMAMKGEDVEPDEGKGRMLFERERKEGRFSYDFSYLLRDASES